KFTASAADLEHVLGLGLGDGGKGHLSRVRPFGEAVGRNAARQARLVRVLPPDELWIVEPHDSTIGWPGSRLPGDFPPSQELTVAPTSENSPSWIRPAAFRPRT